MRRSIWFRCRGRPLLCWRRCGASMGRSLTSLRAGGGDARSVRIQSVRAPVDGVCRREMTAHGFRSMASTLLNEMGWRSDVIERQLAHVDKNKVRSAYNRAEYITERRQMMQAWADFS